MTTHLFSHSAHARVVLGELVTELPNSLKPHACNLSARPMLCQQLSYVFGIYTGACCNFFSECLVRQSVSLFAHDELVSLSLRR